jgi:hypothetical protein
MSMNCTLDVSETFMSILQAAILCHFKIFGTPMMSGNIWGIC